MPAFVFSAPQVDVDVVSEAGEGGGVGPGDSVEDVARGPDNEVALAGDLLIALAPGGLAAPALFVAGRPAGGWYVCQLGGAGSVLDAPEFHV